MMKPRDRVLRAVRHQDTSYVPHNIFFTHQELDLVVRSLGDAQYEDRIGNHVAARGYSGRAVETSRDSGLFQDDFGVVWNRNGVDKDIGMIAACVIPEPDLSRYAFPDVDREHMKRLFSELEDTRHQDQFRVGMLGFSMFERAWSLCGMENLLVYMITDPDFVDALLDRILEFNLEVVDIALRYDIDAFHFGDDWGQQKGLIMGPSYWRRFIRPRMAVLYDKVHSAGKTVSQHSCGDISEILPDLVGIGLEIYQTVQPEIYDLASLKREFGKDLTFWGAISTQRLLPYATPDEVRCVTRRTMEILGANGGYIAAPTHDVPCDVPVENILALVETFLDQKDSE
jgi:uroporphyrinogen decarboxylase